MGSGLTEVKPAQGFAAESSTASTILASSHLGFALSTTQVASGSVIGSGLGRRGSSVRWNMVGKIMIGWLLTLPAAAAVGGIAALIAAIGPTGVIIDAFLGAGVIVFIYVWSRRHRVGAGNAIEIDQAGKAVRGRKATAKARKAKQDA
jgi:PiT family inorganic phosphate transporter